MTDYFTLNPKYERFELGVIQVDYDTLYPPYIMKDNPKWVNWIIYASVVVAVILSVASGISRADIGRWLGGALPYIVVVLIIAVVVSLILDMPKRHRLDRLNREGTVITGKVDSARYELIQHTLVGTRLDFLLGRKPRVEWTWMLYVAYRITPPDGRPLIGEQQRQISKRTERNLKRELLLQSPPEAPLPAKGTPVRVIYLDEKTFTML